MDDALDLQNTPPTEEQLAQSLRQQILYMLNARDGETEAVVESAKRLLKFVETGE